MFLDDSFSILKLFRFSPMFPYTYYKFSNNTSSFLNAQLKWDNHLSAAFFVAVEMRWDQQL